MSTQSEVEAKAHLIHTTLVWHDATKEVPCGGTHCLLAVNAKEGEPVETDVVAGWFGEMSGLWRLDDDRIYFDAVVTHWAEWPAHPMGGKK